MSKAFAQRVSYRIAAESLLLAEEKWILEALKKIKTQRNCLQIERLQLESLKAKLRTVERDTSEGECILPTPIGETIPETYLPTSSTREPIPTTSVINLMQTGNITNSQDIEFETNILDVEAFCNEEALNLDVTNSVFSSNMNVYTMEENEEEEEDDDEEPEDVTVDMDMLMNESNLDE